MSARTDFKNALQALTTTVVKAELLTDREDPAFVALRTTGLEQWKRMRAFHAVFVAEVRATDADARVPHATWLADTEQRATALFGALPEDGSS